MDGDIGRAGIIVALSVTTGGIALIADALKDVVAPGGAGWSVFFAGASLAMNQIFSKAVAGPAAKAMSNLIPNLGNVIAGFMVSSITAEAYMLTFG